MFGARIARTAGLHIAQKLLRHSDIRVTETKSSRYALHDNLGIEAEPRYACTGAIGIRLIRLWIARERNGRRVV